MAGKDIGLRIIGGTGGRNLSPAEGTGFSRAGGGGTQDGGIIDIHGIEIRIINSNGFSVDKSSAAAVVIFVGILIHNNARRSGGGYMEGTAGETVKGGIGANSNSIHFKGFDISAEGSAVQDAEFLSLNGVCIRAGNGDSTAGSVGVAEIQVEDFSRFGSV